MRKLFTIILALNAYVLYGQSNLSPVNDASFYFSEGVLAFQRNQIIKSDSLFTKSLLIEASKDAFFNRAITKLILKDTCLACSDLNYAYFLFDDDSALSVYNKHCLLSFSDIYYDRKYRRINNADEYTYYEEIKHHRCDTVIRGTIHKKNHKSTIQLMGLKEIDTYGTYVMIDTVKYFNFLYGSSFLSDNEVKINMYKDRLKQYLNAKYKLDEIPENIRYFNVKLLISKDGKVTDIIIEKSPFGLLDKTQREIIEADIYHSLKQMPPFKPEKLLNEPVSTMRDITFRF